MKAPEMLFWSRNGQELVPVGHPEAHTQAFFEGQEIPEEHAVKIIAGVRNKMRGPAPVKSASIAEK
jgi:hypothetical protein